MGPIGFALLLEKCTQLLMDFYLNHRLTVSWYGMTSILAQTIEAILQLIGELNAEVASFEAFWLKPSQGNRRPHLSLSR